MENKSKKILSEISAGELLDKISILEIKSKKINDKASQKEVHKEYEILKKIQNLSINFDEGIEQLFNSLKEVNISLWDIEDKLRIHEKNKDFGEKFVELAREVYFKNDKRAKIKFKINKILKSNIIEIKQYVEY